MFFTLAFVFVFVFCIFFTFQRERVEMDDGREGRLDRVTRQRVEMCRDR